MTNENPRVDRREFARLLGATGTAGVVTAGTASAGHTGDVIADHLPGHVSMYYDERKSLIEEYQPRLRTSNLDVTPEAVYAAYFESTEYDTDCIAYWTWYPTQQGITPYDSHYGDAEPVLVFVDDSGAVDRVHYSGWHYLVARYSDPPIADDSGAHPVLTVVNPHHHYVIRPDDPDTGEYPPLDSFIDIVQPWFDNDWPADADTVLHPWTTDYRASWWAEGEFGVRWLEQRAELSLTVAKLSPLQQVSTDI